MRSLQVVSWVLLIAGTGLLTAGVVRQEGRTLWFILSALAFVGSVLAMYVRSKQYKAQQQHEEAQGGGRG